jgi:ankyrin repeat protein
MNNIDQELVEASMENNVPEVRRLLSLGADVHAMEYEGKTPLHWASIKGHVQVFNELVEHGADIEVKNLRGRTPLHLACSYGHLPVAIELCGHGVNIDANNDSHGATTGILGKRKSRGANIEAKDRDGDTPLHLACMSAYFPIVKALLAVGADCRATNNNGRLPLHIVMSYGHSEGAKHLLQHFYATTRRLPLHELLQDLTWIGNLNSSDAPPLRTAIYRYMLGTNDVVEILEYLVGRNPALLTSRDRDGSLPLHLACRRGTSFAIIQSLVNLYKASVKSVTHEGDLPLFLACEIPEPSLDTIFLLMKLYPDLVYR